MRRFLARVLPGLLLVMVACSGPGPVADAVRRGDQAWARGDHEEALAEYRLALRQGDPDSDVLLRVAHAYTRLGRVDDAREYYVRAIELDPANADQAVADLVARAQDANARNDRFGVAAAVEAALDLRPGTDVSGLALPLARYYAGNGAYERALPFFQRALHGDTAGTSPDVVYETARAYEQLGDCVRALVYFERFSDMVPSRGRRDADWHIGNCSYQLAEEARGQGDERRALSLLERTIAIGEPKTLMATAHFERGAILAERGECEAALDSFRRVLREDPSGNGPLVRRAQQWIDDLRFGDRSGSSPRRRCG